MEPDLLPAWAREMRALFRSGTTSQFILHGNVFDLVPGPDGRDFLPLRQYLTAVMFEPFGVVVQYDRGKGIRVRKGAEHFHRFLKAFDAFEGTAWASLPAGGQGKFDNLDLPGLLPREPKRALDLIDRFLRGALARTKVVDGAAVADPLRVAVLIDYAHFIAPQGDPLYLAELSQTLIQLLDWASDPAITGAFAATVLITENLSDLNRSLVENPYSAKIRLELPSAPELQAFIAHLTRDVADFSLLSDLTRDVLAERLVGLSRVSARTLVSRSEAAGTRLTEAYLTRMKKEVIEKEAFGRLEFLESARTLDDVAGHDEAKRWLRQDAILLRKGIKAAIPMGYLLTGRIGTGKTYLVECLAGEIGIPCVEMKNFREKWVGATEGNLEKVFTILHALGQVIVFVDEADQAMGRRGGGEGDAGLSGRVYAMMAREMSDTANRGKIIWIFATSRPDLLEVDLKRQGRLDVHIPLFPPGTPDDRRALFAAMARKLRIPLAPEELPPLPDNDQLGGNEMEGILVRALRQHESQPPDGRRPLPEIIADVIREVRPSAHSERLELMDLLAVKECTDARFLPERFRSLPLAELNRRISVLKTALGEPSSPAL
ncbi:MAG TPA: AAA family ATPase [Candidatus Krumholzibacteria bacterium]|nr:AAA family ATPase [Candidatus Krumholzibacteria bacterium]HPD73087.1 AAA family ATPase [Candidatus Krumholzibacteria bacterium]HRY41887.1 AAA family ATPase [Candidatus Krumholzibacteria bacterium]